jgi:hypothetical protein
VCEDVLTLNVSMQINFTLCPKDVNSGKTVKGSKNGLVLRSSTNQICEA